MLDDKVELSQEVIDTALHVLDKYKITPFHVEVPFINTTLGFGGRIDLVGDWPVDALEGIIHRNIILDWKFRETRPGQKITMWDDYITCLAGYGVGFTNKYPLALCESYDLVNVVVSHNEPGRYELKVWTYEEINHAWRVFYADLQAWFVDKKYDPREGIYGYDEEG